MGSVDAILRGYYIRILQAVGLPSSSACQLVLCDAGTSAAPRVEDEPDEVFFESSMMHPLLGSM